MTTSAMLADLPLSRNAAGLADNTLGNCLTLIKHLIDDGLFDWADIDRCLLQWEADPVPRDDDYRSYELDNDAIRIVAALQLADHSMRRLTDSMMLKALYEQRRRTRRVEQRG